MTDKIKGIPIVSNPVLAEALQAKNITRIYTLEDQEKERSTSGNLFFRFNGEQGIELEAGKRIIVVLEGQNKKDGPQILQSMFLGHRKDKKYWHLEEGKEYDPNGAYTQVSIFDGITNKWIPWKDAKGYDPIKYAERRHSVEYEMMGDINYTLGQIKPLAISLTSSGKGNPAKSIVTEHSLEIMLRPEVDNDLEEKVRIFTPGTRFANYKAQKGSLQSLTVYGGGKKKYPKGDQQVAHTITGYPESVPLGGREQVNSPTIYGPTGHEPFKMTTKFESKTESLDEKNQYKVKLEEGLQIKGCEVAVGARWWDDLPHQDLASKGGRKLNAYLCNANGVKVSDLIMQQNVGPTGTLIGSLKDSSYVTKPGDYLVIAGGQHVSYLMGYRLFYKKNSQSVGSEIKASLLKWFNGNPNTDTTSINSSTFNPEQANTEFDLEPINKEAGGTQGGKWYRNKLTGKNYFAKKYEMAGENAKNRRATEYIANKLYTLMGIPVAKCYLHKDMLLSEEIINGKGFYFSGADRITQGKKTFQNESDITDGFLVDAWLANWDIFGLNYDNIVNSNGRMYRVDNGGCLFFRALGSHKPSFANPEVSELTTMRNPNKANEAGPVFELINEKKICDQADKLKKLATDAQISKIVQESGISNPEQVLNALKSRRDWILAKYT